VRERGSALLTALVAVMILMLIAGISFAVVNSQAKVESSEERALRAYYLAEAGINYEIAAVLNDRNLPQNTPIQIVDPFGAGYGGEFSVQWEDDGNTYTFHVTSTATYLGVIRTLTEQYKYPTP